ncbi:MAG TPA: ABC-F family ATP-binding cassette domain-containing protein [Stellaceae bacterium]|jgi:ATP-binding cassette subfamily F protein 3|nr:ABC-F family ATP-binding cassette domain-containing protein [Stellaceae bacterium]
MLTISDVTYRVGGKRGRALLDHASAQIPEGSKLGLVGRNGIGKSTLLDLIRGRLMPDDGDLLLPRGHRIGFLAQEAPSGSATPLATVLAADRERARLMAELDADPSPLRLAEIEARLDTIGARAAPGRAARILAGLGFDQAMQEGAIDELSGGWRMRVALAAVLFAEPDLLLLDEPTNHLDMEASLWLERYLRRYRHSFIVVSHDRQLLNAATTTILHLDRGKLTLYSGNFDAYLRARGAAKARQAALAQRQDAQRRHMQEFVDRFRFKASKARQAQSRLKALAKLEPVAMIAETPPIELRLPQPAELRPPLITLEKASVGYVADKPVLAGLDLRLDPDDRIALLGANGNGKTTFARLLAGRLPASAGKVTRPSKLVTGFFAQHQIEEMRPGESAYDHLAALMPDLTEEAVRTRLGGFGFGQDKAFVPVSSLSGGERARLNLALVTHDTPAMLILDEPTNHLDMETRESLVAALADYSGAVVLVSHDWHLVELVADRLWLVEGGTVRPFDGDLDAYRQRLLERDDEAVEKSNGGGNVGDLRRAARRDAADRRLAAEPLRRKARAAEAAAARFAAEQKTLDRKLAEPAAFGGRGSAALTEALKRRAELARLISEAEAEWLDAEMAIEQMTAQMGG